jgi:hypothetical protein
MPARKRANRDDERAGLNLDGQMEALLELQRDAEAARTSGSYKEHVDLSRKLDLARQKIQSAYTEAELVAWRIGFDRKRTKQPDDRGGLTTEGDLRAGRQLLSMAVSAYRRVEHAFIFDVDDPDTEQQRAWVRKRLDGWYPFKSETVANRLIFMQVVDAICDTDPGHSSFHILNDPSLVPKLPPTFVVDVSEDFPRTLKIARELPPAHPLEVDRIDPATVDALFRTWPEKKSKAGKLHGKMHYVCKALKQMGDTSCTETAVDELWRKRNKKMRK